MSTMGQLSGEVTGIDWRALEVSAPWHVLHVRSRTEKVVANKIRTFRGEPIHPYLPLRERVQKYQRRMVTTRLPLFPGYLFVRGGDQAARDFAWSTREVVSCLPVYDQQAFGQSMESLAKMLESGMPVSPVEKLESGSQVEIISGPLTGLRGRVVSTLKSMRFILVVDMLQQGASVEVDQEMIQRL